MSIRQVPFAPKEFYHIYNRGNSKQKIFHDHKDYEHFMALLYACNGENNFKAQNLGKDESPYDFERGALLAAVGAYCLMPNHFHLVLIQLQKDGISKFLQKVSTAYVMYYNKKYKRTGSLFEGKFKAEHLDSDNYLKYIFSYNHLNPLKLIDKNWKEKGMHDKTKALEYLAKYQYSSYLDYLGKKRIQSRILNITVFPSYFPTKKDFLKEIFEWISFSEID